MNKIIENYAHDYRNMSMSEEEIGKVFESFCKDIHAEELKNGRKARILEKAIGIVMEFAIPSMNPDDFLKLEELTEKLLNHYKTTS